MFRAKAPPQQLRLSGVREKGALPNPPAVVRFDLNLVPIQATPERRRVIIDETKEAVFREIEEAINKVKKDVGGYQSALREETARRNKAEQDNRRLTQELADLRKEMARAPSLAHAQCRTQIETMQAQLAIASENQSLIWGAAIEQKETKEENEQLKRELAILRGNMARISAENAKQQATIVALQAQIQIAFENHLQQKGF